MSRLEGYRVVVLAPPHDSESGRRVRALERAGAMVRVCVLGQSLWSDLSDGATDVAVFLASSVVREARFAHEQLAIDPRTRSLPALFVTDLAVDASSRPIAVLSARAGDALLVQAVVEFAAPYRRLSEIERELRQQLLEELARSERYARERSDLAHEVRAMLGAILGFGCNLRDEIAGPLSADQRTHVAKILDAVDRANRVLTRRPTGTFAPIAASVRTLSMRPRSAPSGPPRAQRTLVNLSRIAEEIVSLFDGLAARRAITLHVQSDPAVAVWGDALKLKQVLSNLVVNAIKYSPERSAVSVEVAWITAATSSGLEGRRSAGISVKDSGRGIPREHRESIFQRGFRLEQHAATPGEGIGLSVVREIVLQHGGSIEVDGSEGEGAIFRVALPQDRRQRARSGALVMCDGPDARAIVDQLVAADPPFGHLITPDERDDFIERARAARAAILLSSDEELSAALAHFPDPQHSREEGEP